MYPARTIKITAAIIATPIRIPANQRLAFSIKETNYSPALGNPHEGGERRSRSDRVNPLAFGFACV